MSVGRSLQWLRGSNKNVELELDTIRSNIRTSRFNMDNNMNSNLSSISHNGLPMKYSFKSIVTNVKSVLRNARLVKPILITCGLMIFQRFTGEWNNLRNMCCLPSHLIPLRRKFIRILRRQNIPSNILGNEPTRRVSVNRFRINSGSRRCNNRFCVCLGPLLSVLCSYWRRCFPAC